MKIDNIDYFSVDKLQTVIEQRFGQKIELSEMTDSTLELFKQSVSQSIASFEKAMGFNSNSQNPKYLENKLLQDAIIKEQEMRVKRVQGDEIEIEDPSKPGVTTTVDTKQVDVDQDAQGNVEIKSKSSSGNNSNQNVKVGQKVTMPEDMDKDVEMFKKYLESQNYKILGIGGSAKGVTFTYADEQGDEHTVSFKKGGIMEKEEEGDLEDVVAPEFKKLVHDMQQGMSKEKLEKKYPKRKDDIEQLSKDLASIAEHMKMAVQGQLSEVSYRLGGREMAALRLLVGNENFTMAKRA